MNRTTSSETQTAGRRRDDTTLTVVTEDVDPQLQRRKELRLRHAQRLAQLMEQRADLRGVTPLADFVDDSIRWSA